MSGLTMGPTTGVIVTGGASGIGRASARAVAEVGRPVALWDLDGPAATAAAEEVTSTFGVPAVGLAVDLTDTAAFPTAIDRSRAVMGTVGGLVHAAGRVIIDPVGDFTAEGWDAVMDLNVRAEALLVQALLDDLRANPGSAVVGISSIEAIVGNWAITSYCASKAALLSVTRSLAQALAGDGIRVNAVCPGVIETPMLTSSVPDESFLAQMLAGVPLGRIGQPAEIGRAVRFLLSDEASYVTATELVVDGGLIAVH